MKLQQRLTINNSVVEIVDRTTSHDLYSPGRAVFEVITKEAPTGLVELHIGYKDKLTPYFLGAIESKIKKNNSWLITCRELIGALSFGCDFSLRHPTLRDVLEQINRCGVTCIAPDTKYAQTKIPAFCHVGDGVTALRQIGNAFDISDYIFQQRSGGTIYVGSWHDSNWSQPENARELPLHVFTSHSAKHAKLVAIPHLRPGIKINDRYVKEVKLVKSQQEITWSQSLSNV